MLQHDLRLQSINTGRMTFDGADMTGLRPTSEPASASHDVPATRIFGSLSVRENVLAAAEIRRRWSHDRSDAGANADAVLHLVGLSQLATSAADTLPTGQARLLELARALATRPRLLLLDEPSSGLSDTESEELGDLLCQLAEAGMGVLLVEHDMGLVMRVCTDINVLDFGAVLMAGSPAEIRADERVRAAYLGAADDPERDSHEADVAVAGVGPSAVGDGSSTVRPMAEPPVLELRRVHAAYGQIEVLHGIDLAVANGSVLALLGPNGAGKSTTLRGGERADGADQGLLPCPRAATSTACGPTSWPAPGCARCPTGAASSPT